jgi:hypothetical protein
MILLGFKNRKQKSKKCSALRTEKVISSNKFVSWRGGVSRCYLLLSHAVAWTGLGEESGAVFVILMSMLACVSHR